MEQKTNKTQWIIIGVLVVFLLVIWMFVLMELLNPKQRVLPVNDDEQVKDVDEILAEFEKEIEQSEEETTENEITENDHTLEEELEQLREEEVEDADTSEEEKEKINLFDYDFTDIATKDGIPIDGILERLRLNFR